VTANTYVDTTVNNGTTYYYVVTAVNSAGESPSSSYVGATPQGAPPAPTNLTASTGARRGTISLSWTAAPGATTYQVKRALTSGGPYSPVKTVTKTAYTDSKLTSGSTYYYVVVALNAAGQSPPSNQASAAAR
jgi:cellulose 1,4-beta-cellobiosidase